MIPKDYELHDLEAWEELDLEDRISVIKSTVSIPDVASLLLGQDLRAGDKIPSPWNPDERTPSCHLYDDHFFDYSSGRGGDIFDLMAACNSDYAMSGIKAMVRILRYGALNAGKEYGEVEQQKPREIQDFRDLLPPTKFTALDLKISLEYDVRIDDEDNIVIPHRDPDGVYGVKVRYARGGKGSWAGSQFTHRLYDPYGWAPGHSPTSEVVICEGESDCWALTQAVYYDVLALPSGVSTWRDHWKKDLQCYNRVWICMDNDRAGQECRQKLESKVGWERSKVLQVPQLYKDARAALDAGWKPDLG